MSDFGTTAWGRVWLRLAEPVSVTRPDPQLPRARSLARRDRVREMTTGPGRITAVVDDGGDHRVELHFPVWSRPPRIADPELPDELVETLAGEGTPVAPGAGDLATECDCRARDGRCRHVLAVLMETARRADETPSLALALRGAEPARTAVDRDRIPITDLDPETFWSLPPG
ncbi:hypothetical protein WIS52_24775 [Pseudonocardia nematodicida]|uniref:SWIM-type domain-containing protein n=1 Tax=Pseudonocardia nematodicida TaxID=1206997 RepID=A0ABV1KGW6_9PSEU